MPVYQIASAEVNISRRAVLVDTNVLVAAFWDRDAKHRAADEFLQLWDDQLVVPVVVVVEAWGMLCQRDKLKTSAYRLVAWLNNPGNAVLLLPQEAAGFDSVASTMASLRVDCVDALLMHLADDLSRQCEMNPAMLIATFDMRDFWPVVGRGDFRFNLMDVATLEPLHFDQ